MPRALCVGCRDGFTSTDENGGRNEWCFRFCRTDESRTSQKYPTVMDDDLELRDVASEFDIFVSKEHGDIGLPSSIWPTLRGNRIDVCIWLRPHQRGEQGARAPTLLSTTELLAALQTPGLVCALPIEFKMGLITKGDVQSQIVGYCHKLETLLQTAFNGAGEGGRINGYAIIFLGNYHASSNGRQTANLFSIREYVDVSETGSIRSGAE